MRKRIEGAVTRFLVFVERVVMDWDIGTQEKYDEGMVLCVGGMVI